MATTLSNSARKVQEFLAARGYDFKVKELPDSARTAQEAADSIGCSVAQIAKSLIFRNMADDKPLLVIASGANRVDPAKIQAATGLELGKADGKFVREKVGFAIGGIPPVGHSEQLATILDPDLLQYAEIWAAAGTPHAVFPLTPADLVPLTGGKWVELAETCG